MIDKNELKELLFEIYAAGYQDCMNNKDIIKGWNDFWNYIIRSANNDKD